MPHIKVVLYRESHPTTPTSVVCAHIRNTITSMLTEINRNFKYLNARLQYGFECTNHLWDSVLKLLTLAPLHLCILEDESSPKMKCLKDLNVTKTIPLIDSRQTIWFNKV